MRKNLLSRSCYSFRSHTPVFAANLRKEEMQPDKSDNFVESPTSAINFPKMAFHRFLVCWIAPIHFLNIAITVRRHFPLDKRALLRLILGSSNPINWNVEKDFHQEIQTPIAPIVHPKMISESLVASSVAERPARRAPLERRSKGVRRRLPYDVTEPRRRRQLDFPFFPDATLKASLPRSQSHYPGCKRPFSQKPVSMIG
jgi:hypothetical protein